MSTQTDKLMYEICEIGKELNIGAEKFTATLGIIEENLKKLDLGFRAFSERNLTSDEREFAKDQFGDVSKIRLSYVLDEHRYASDVWRFIIEIKKTSVNEYVRTGDGGAGKCPRKWRVACVDLLPSVLSKMKKSALQLLCQERHQENNKKSKLSFERLIKRVKKECNLNNKQLAEKIESLGVSVDTQGIKRWSEGTMPRKNTEEAVAAVLINIEPDIEPVPEAGQGTRILRAMKESFWENAVEKISEITGLSFHKANLMMQKTHMSKHNQKLIANVRNLTKEEWEASLHYGGPAKFKEYLAKRAMNDT